jgi:hypothetical protein
MGLALLCGLPSACSVAADERATYQVPPFETFAPVGEALHASCGSLDCHGTPERNMRLYGVNGLRLDSADYPGSSITTEAEIRENYVSVIALEPELLRTVFLQGGANPDRLTLIQKGRGAHHHKGGVAMRPGEAPDRCILSWLANRVDELVCAAAAEVVRPGMEMPPVGPPP